MEVGVSACINSSSKQLLLDCVWMFQATKTSFLGHMLQIVFLMMTVSHVEAYSYFLLASSCGCFPPVFEAAGC